MSKMFDIEIEYINGAYYRIKNNNDGSFLTKEIDDIRPYFFYWINYFLEKVLIYLEYKEIHKTSPTKQLIRKNEATEYYDLKKIQDMWFGGKITLKGYIEALYNFYVNCESDIWRYWAIRGLIDLKQSRNNKIFKIFRDAYLSDESKIVRLEAIYGITYLYKDKLPLLVDFILENEEFAEIIGLIIFTLRKDYKIKLNLKKK